MHLPVKYDSQLIVNYLGVMLRKPILENALSLMTYESKFWNGKTVAFSRMIALEL